MKGVCSGDLKLRMSEEDDDEDDDFDKIIKKQKQMIQKSFLLHCNVDYSRT